MNAPLIIICTFFLFSIYLAIRSKKGKKMDHEGWTTGGRSYGALLVFLLSAGEIYTTFTFLGAVAGLMEKAQPYYIRSPLMPLWGYHFIGFILLFGSMLKIIMLGLFQTSSH